jgi:hypothetical protein
MWDSLKEHIALIGFILIALFGTTVKLVVSRFTKLEERVRKLEDTQQQLLLDLHAKLDATRVELLTAIMGVKSELNKEYILKQECPYFNQSKGECDK